MGVFVTFAIPLKKPGIYIMSFNIVKQLNADAQEGAATDDGAETAATTNVPAEAPKRNDPLWKLQRKLFHQKIASKMQVQ